MGAAMDREERIVARGQPLDLEIVSHHRHRDYDIEKHDMQRGPTGLLRMFSLTPRTEDRPTFQARWDDGAPKRLHQEDVDIDILGVDEDVRRDFKAGRNGYCGHHSNRAADPDKRIYDIKIAVPDGVIFEGTASFRLSSSVRLKDELCAVDKVDAEIVKPAAK